MRYFGIIGLCLATGCGTSPGDRSTTEGLTTASTAAEDADVSQLSAIAYARGPHEVVSHDFERASFFAPDLPPVATRVHAPVDPGTYPVLMLLSCLVCSNGFLDDVLTHVASHGFVVTVPTLHSVLDVLTANGRLSAIDAEAATKVAVWIETHLNDHMLEHMATRAFADPTSMALVGFSSGGKAAWMLAEEGKLPVTALAGLSPVDGLGDPFGFAPEAPILDEPFGFSMPVLVMGNGHDAEPAQDSMPACAPDGQNHEQFFAGSRPPAWHVVAEDAGHVDVVDADMSGLLQFACPSDLVGDETRELSRGMLAAFLRAAMKGETAMYQVLSDVDSAPTPIRVASKTAGDEGDGIDMEMENEDTRKDKEEERGRAQP